MVDIAYSLETLTGKHGGLLEVVEAIVSDGRLIMILTDEDVLQKRDAPIEGHLLSRGFAASTGEHSTQRRSFRTGPGKSQISGGWQGFGEPYA